MKKESLIVKTKRPKGEDGYKTFSIRIKEEPLQKLMPYPHRLGIAAMN